jgi:hypothetical protein
MFCLEHKSSRHSPPKMQVTFKKLTTYMEAQQAHIFTPNRDSEYSIPDVMDKGMTILMTRNPVQLEDEREAELGDPEFDEWADLGDEVEEVEDDGSLDLL